MSFARGRHFGYLRLVYLTFYFSFAFIIFFLVFINEFIIFISTSFRLHWWTSHWWR